MGLLTEELTKPSDVLKLKYLPITLSLLLFLLALPISVFVATSQEPLDTRSRAQTTRPTPPPKPSHSVTIDAPKDGDEISAAKVTVTGRTSKGATVVIEAGDATEIVEANPAGVFTASVTPGEGPATITVTSFDENGSEATSSIDVVSASESQ